MIAIVKQKQSIHDIAAQYTGSSEHAIAILLANGKTDTSLSVGEALQIPTHLLSIRTESFFRANNLNIGCSGIPLDENEWNPELPGEEVVVNINSIYYKTANTGIDIPVLNSAADKIATTLSSLVIANDLEFNVLYDGKYKGTKYVAVGTDSSFNLSDVTIPGPSGPASGLIYTPGNVNIRINSKYYKTVTAPAEINIPLQNSIGDDLIFEMSGDNIILPDDTNIKIFLDTVLISDFEIPVSAEETINIQ